MKHFITIITLCLTCQLYAQSEAVNKLLEIEQTIAEGNLSEGEMLGLYTDLIYEYCPRDKEKTKFYFREAISYADEKKNIAAKARLYAEMGYVFSKWREKDSVDVYMDKALELIVEKDYSSAEKVIHELRGRSYVLFDMYEKGLNAYLKALEINEIEKAQYLSEGKELAPHLIILEASVRINIANIYIFLYNYDRGIEQYLQGKKIIDDNPNLYHYLAPGELSVLSNLSEVYLTIKQYEKALPYIKEYYEKALADENPSRISIGLALWSDYYRETGELKKALTYAQEALQIAEETNNPINIGSAEEVLTKAYIYLKDYKKALYYAERQLSKIDVANFQLEEQLFSDMILIHALMGNREEAEKYLNKIGELIERKSNKNMHESLQEMEVKYDTQQKELEIARQEAKIEKHQIRQYILIGGLIIAGILLTLLIYIANLRAKRNKALAETNATKDKFFSIISHDLKNPAIAQRDALQELIKYSDKWDADSLSQYYEELLKSADGQIELLYNLLNWAQVQTGRMPYNPTQFDMSSELRSEIALIRNMAERKNISLEVQMPDTSIITGDRNMFTTIVRNLLTNAVKFTGKNGHITLEIKPDENCNYTISVADTGRGMSREEVETLFNIDRQRSQRGTEGEQGSGLGLIVCKELIEKHGSRLYVESEEGKGSRFSFVLQTKIKEIEHRK
ncbi:hypothetical protein LJC06_00525 [Bacteroidales bacterium OttesenSCG-928-I14]|nr:hypothetical protein [Bacteroidales bacterium OttesenSCG-928-I14]